MGILNDAVKKFESENPKTNASGCLDLTAYQAIEKADADLEKSRLPKLIDIIKGLCETCGFTVEGRIVLKGKSTGKIYK